MKILFLLPVLLFAMNAFAQQPVDPAAHFPDAAITTVTPPTPDAGKKADVPLSPTAPAQPNGPVSDLWPANTVPVFMISCANYHKELIQPCRCVIDSLMHSMTHREFIEITEKQGIDKDSRYINARQLCLAKPQRK